MPNHKSSAKRIKTAAKERERNRAFRSNLRSAMRELRATTNKEQAAAKLREVSILLDRAAGGHLIHWRNADRNKSRLAKHVGRLA